MKSLKPVINPRAIPYQILAVATAVMGFACTFYLPVIEIVLEVDILVTIKSTESFTLQELRQQMIESDMDVMITNMSILSLLLGSVVSLVSLKKIRLLLLGSALQLLSFVMLYYDATGTSQQTGTDSFLSNALSVNPTVWLYALISVVGLSVLLSAVTEMRRLVSTNRDN